MTAARAWCGVASSRWSIGSPNGTTAAGAAAGVGGCVMGATAPKPNAKIAPPPTDRHKVTPTVRFKVQPPSLSWISCAVYAFACGGRRQQKGGGGGARHALG